MTQSAGTTSGNANGRQTIDSLQTDIGFANRYRLAWIKAALAIAAALLAFTVSFQPGRGGEGVPSAIYFVYVGWVMLSISVFSGLLNLIGWERFYISYRDYDWKGECKNGKMTRIKITYWRRTAAAFQIAGFVIGVPAIALFAALNVHY